MAGLAIHPDRVAVYIRWSTDDQGEGTTLDVQADGCKHYMLSQGWRFTPDLLFVDDGYSGASLERPALTRLRQAISGGLVTCVVVYKIDRLSRSVVDTVNLVLREWEGRCHVKSAREAIDTVSPQGKMFFYTLVSFAEWERSVIRERTLAGRLRRLHEGRNPGFRPPYGLCRGDTPGSFAVVPAEAALVQRIFALHARGMGYKRIAVSLMQEGLQFRGGRPWTAQAVMAVVRNPLYAGRLVWGRRSREQATVAVVSPRLPAIVTPAEWEQSQQRRQAAPLPSRSVSSDHLLTGILRCRRCGSAMMGRRRAPDGAAYYVCTGQRNKGRGFCDSSYIREDLLDRWILERLAGRYAGVMLPGAGGAQVGRRERLNQALADARRELTGLQRQLGRIGQEYRQERLTAEEYRELRAAALQERQAAEVRAADLEAALSVAAPVAGEPLPAVAPPGAQARKHLLRELIGRLAVYRAPGTATVEFDLAWVTGA